MFSMFLRELRFRRNGIIGWGLAVSALPFLYISIYPEFADQMPAFEEMMDLAFYRAMGISMADFESYIASTVTNIVSILVAIYAIINATATLAGEEDDGRLELIVALPKPRWQIVTTKAAAVGVALLLVLLIIGLISALTFAAVESRIESVLSAADILVALIYTWPIIMAMAMIALFLGTFCPSRRVAALLSTLVFVVSYFGSNLAGLVTSLESIKPLFLYHYFDATAELLINGPEASDLLVLLGVALIAFLLAVLFFQWRNVTVGAWPWQKGRIPA